MTCGACAARIERRLNRLDGVAATVNYATGRAYFTSTGGRGPAELIGVIESAGYTADLPRRRPRTARQAPDPQTRALARRLAVCGPLAVAVIVLSMVPGRAVPRLAVGEPAAGRAGRRPGAPGRCTGPPGTASATAPRPWTRWSAWASARRSAGRCTRCCSAGAGATGMKMSFAFTFGQAGADTLYLEAAAGVTAAVLAGRYLEARARDRSGLALSRAGRPGRQDRRGAPRRRRAADPGRGARRRGPVRGPAGGEDRHRRDRGRGRLGGGRVAGHRRVDAGRGRPGRPGDRRHGEHERPAGGAGPPRSARTPCWRRSPAWSARRRPPRPARSGWPTGSPRCSSRA